MVWRDVRGEHEIRNTLVSFRPLVSEVALEVPVAWGNWGQFFHDSAQFVLSVCLFDEEIVFVHDHRVAGVAGSREDFETTAKGQGRVGAEVTLEGPMELVYHRLLLVALYATTHTDIVTVQPTFALLAVG